MTEHLQTFSIQIEQKLYEKSTPLGNLVVYQTSLFGLMLTLNQQMIISESDSFFSHEMLSHPALFSHPHPKHVAILGNYFGILDEVLKHLFVTNVKCVVENSFITQTISLYFSQFFSTIHDERVTHHTANPLEWLSQCENETFDIIILNPETEFLLKSYLPHAYRVLRQNGILVTSFPSAFIHTKNLTPTLKQLKEAKFHDWQILNYPQPSCPPGWHNMVMATKSMGFKRLNEKNIFNKPFNTRYYNFDTHKAALALPEFMRIEIDSVNKG